MSKPRLSEGRIPFQLGVEVAPTPPPVALPYQGDTTIYDLGSPTGSIAGGTILPPEYVYE